MKKSWKTTFAGILALLGVVGKLVAEPKALGGDDIAIIATGIGLIVAKDFNATGAPKS